MSSRQRKWRCGLLLPILILAAKTAGADQTISYLVSGSAGAVLWQMGSQPGTGALIFAFTQAAPVKAGVAAPTPIDETAQPGPRVVFLVTDWALVDNQLVQRQWYGDEPLASNALVIAGDLTQGALDTPVMGTLVESSQSGTMVQRDMPGRLQVKWAGSGDLANTTITDSYQTSGHTTALQTAGTGRVATASGTITVPALGAPIPLQTTGSLSSVASGLLTVTAP